MFHLSAPLVALLTLTLRVQAQTPTTLAYDTNYDNGNLPLTSVSCSDGANGLMTKGYTTLGSLPSFPFVGGSYTVSGWNSTKCGVCNAITYGGTTIYVLNVDKSTTGFTVSEEAMNALTGNEAVAYGRVDVTYVEVDASLCKMPATH